MHWETHPQFLRRSKIPLTIVCGPPCSGKTTYVQEHRKPGDMVIDLDAICQQLDPTFRTWSGRTDKAYKALLDRAFSMRNRMLARLAETKTGQAWFIISAPTLEERSWWQSRLGGRVVVMNPGMEECKRRARARSTLHAAQGVDTWQMRAEQPWSPPTHRHAIGADGWPRELEELDRLENEDLLPL